MVQPLVLRVAQDAYRGDALFNVYVDGVQVGGTHAASASHAAGQWQDVMLTGDFGARPGAVEVRFLNDAWGGTADTDRNLYVDQLVLNGRTFEATAAANYAGSASGGAAALYGAGSLIFDTSCAPEPALPVPAPGPTAPHAPSGPGLSLLGVNLAGPDFAAHKLPGIVGTDYVYPTGAEIDYYAGKGLNVIRLPFLWERLQPVPGGELDRGELARIDAVVEHATAKGLKVVVEPHDYGRGYGHVIGGAETPDGTFADLWGRLAGHLRGNGDVMFGLMNEPHQQDATQWLASANAAIAAIRGAGATAQTILVPGTYWDGAHGWVSSDNDTVVGAGVVDPAGNFAFEVHQYLDADSSGTTPDVVSPSIGVERLTEVTRWAEEHGQRLFLGEFGAAPTAAGLEALDKMVSYMDQHEVWLGATYWAGGPWWGDYMFSIEPVGLGMAGVTDKPQMGVLTSYLP